MLTAASAPWRNDEKARRMDFPRWLRSHRGAIAMAGMLAFAGPLTFFAGAASLSAPSATPGLARLAMWWTLYGVALWCFLLIGGYAVERLDRRAGRRTVLLGWLTVAAMVAAGSDLATAGRAAVVAEEGLAHSPITAQLHAFTWSLVMALLYFAHLRRSRSHEAAAARLAAAQAAQRRTRRNLVQAQLKEVQARIDPEVLFELLGTVRNLYARDVVLAERFLDELVAFLRAALPRLRSPSSSLLREVELVQAFVRLQCLGSGKPAELAVDVATDAMHARFPAGVLLPLVHAAGGAAGPARLSALRKGGACAVVLSVGNAPPVRALEAVRALLAGVHGDDARLDVLPVPRGTEVLIEVPYEPA